jgi:hypothetical protein
MTFGAERDLFSIYAGHGFTKGVQFCIDSFDMFQVVHLDVLGRTAISTVLIQRSYR